MCFDCEQFRDSVEGSRLRWARLMITAPSVAEMSKVAKSAASSGSRPAAASRSASWMVHRRNSERPLLAGQVLRSKRRHQVSASQRS